MSRVLVDTSIWIEFFAPNPALSENFLSILQANIAEGNVVIIHPIRTELLSGHITKSHRQTIDHLLMALEFIDIDWGKQQHWDEIITFAEVARKKGLAIPGIIDRMILLSAQRAGVAICTLDKALTKLAHAIDVQLWPTTRLAPLE